MARRFTLMALAAVALALSTGSSVLAHCQIPCGIYDDPLRFQMLREHVTTIEKSMNVIKDLSAAEEKDYNQIVRWVNNKDKHADELTDIVTYYFLAQRIKVPVEGDKAAAAKYAKDLALLHGMIVRSMKAKQTTDLAHVEALRSLIDQFEASYFGKPAPVAHEHAAAEHSHEHGEAGHTH